MTEDQKRLYDKFEASRHFLQAALDRDEGRYAMADILDGIMEGNLQLWSSPEFAAVTEVLDYPRRRVVRVHLAGGNMDALIATDGDLTRLAQVVGATGIEITGRRGWVRKLAEHGYRESAVRLFKEVPHERRE